MSDIHTMLALIKGSVVVEVHGGKYETNKFQLMNYHLCHVIKITIWTSSTTTNKCFYLDFVEVKHSVMKSELFFSIG